MHARVSTYEASDSEGLAEGFGSVTNELEQVDGFSHGYFLVNRETGKGLSITIWESEDALQASASRADELRAKGTEPSGAEILSVDSYEIVQVAGTPRIH
jgi:heme-degrading monooxygenase HmoA